MHLEGEAWSRYFRDFASSAFRLTTLGPRASLGVFSGDHVQAIAKRLDRQATLYNRAR